MSKTKPETAADTSVVAVVAATTDAPASPAPAAAPEPVKAQRAPKAKAPATPMRKAKATPVTKPSVKAVVKTPAKTPVKAAVATTAKPASKAPKAPKAAKPVKHKLVRDSFTFPEPEYLTLVALKKRLLAAGTEVKKGELVRAGLALLCTLDDAALTAAVGRVEKLKTGRPAK